MQNMSQFQLLLFHRDIASSQIYSDAGVDALIVDLENRGKGARQLGFDTEINTHSLADLEAVKNNTNAHVMCRINGPSKEMHIEIADVLNAGADEIIVPMIRHIDQACAAVEGISGKAKITLMVETQEALSFVPAMSALPIDRIYIGLNDLQISRGSVSIFSSLIDGSLDTIRSGVNGVQFGFGGLTLRGMGRPLPVSHLVANLARLQADFTFLRRSFYHDIKTHNPIQVLAQMRQDIHDAKQRNQAQIATDYLALKSAIQDLEIALSA